LKSDGTRGTYVNRLPMDIGLEEPDGPYIEPAELGDRFAPFVENRPIRMKRARRAPYGCWVWSAAFAPEISELLVPYLIAQSAGKRDIAGQIDISAIFRLLSGSAVHGGRLQRPWKSS